MNKGTETKKPEKKLPIIPPCKICGEPASGFHYGLNSCGACKAFYLRSLARSEPYACLGDGHCKIGPEVSRRKSCQKCRFDKCLRLGMSKNAIKIGRYTYSKRTQDILELKQITEAGGVVPDVENCNDPGENRVHKETSVTIDERFDEKRYDSQGLERRSTHPIQGQADRDFQSLSISSTEQKSDSGLFSCESMSIKSDTSMTRELPHLVGHFTDSCGNSMGPEYHSNTHGLSSSYIPNSISYDDEKRFLSSETPPVYMETERSCDSTMMDQSSNSETHQSLCCSTNSFTATEAFTEPLQGRRGVNSRWENSMLRISPEFVQPFLFYPRSPDMRASVLQSSKIWITELSQSLVKDELSNSQMFVNSGHASGPIGSSVADGHFEDSDVGSSHTVDTCYSDTEVTHGHSNSTTTSIISKSMHTLNGDLPDLVPAVRNGDLYRSTANMTNDWDHFQGFDSRKTNNDPSQPMEDQNFNESVEIIDLSKKIVDLRTTGTSNDDRQISVSEVTTTMQEPSFDSAPTSTCVTDGVHRSIEHGDSDVCYKREIMNHTTPKFLTHFTSHQISESRHCQIWSSEFTETELDEWSKALVSYHFNHVVDNNGCDDAQLRERTNTIYNEYRLQENTFGELKALDRELYFEVYKSTGLDVDGRGKLTSTFLRGIQNEISTMINFFKQIPGFRNLPINDQSVLVKGCAHEYQILGLYRGWNDRTRLTTFIPLGATLSEQDMRKIFPDEAYFSHITMAETLQRLRLTFEQVVILKAIVATTPDREKLESKAEVSDIHWKLINCLLLVLWQQELQPLQKFSQIMSVLTEMRNYSVDIRQSYMNIKADIEELTGKDNIPLVFELLF